MSYENNIITYFIFPSFLCYILIATNTRGICALFLNHKIEKLTDELTKQFPNADLIYQQNDWIAQTVTKILNKKDSHLPLLDIQGTSFQKSVWQAITDVPKGTTRSYQDIAYDIKKPKAIRAVANACKANKIALLIPCHRIISKTGALSGYRWGSDIKEKLLEHEKKFTHSLYL